MEEERFRVSVCLQHYYNDQRSRVYISVIPKNKVNWLQERLCSLFALEGRFFLCSRGHFLHPDEPLSILKPDDPVEVVPLLERGLKDNGKRNSNGIDFSQAQESLPSLLFNNSSKKVPIKELPTKEVPIKELAMQQEDTTNNKLLEMKQQALQLLEQFSDVNEHYVDELDGSSVPSSFAEAPKRRRRVRRRKRRTSEEQPPNNGDLLATEERHTTEPSDPTGETPNGFIAPRKPRLIHSLSP